MTNKEFNSLSGKILIASPFSMEGNVFHKSMIYIVQHTDKGAVGLIFNRPIKNMPADTLMKKIENDIVLPDIGLDAHVGGPVEPERGFFLHSMDYNKNLLFKPASDDIGISSNTEIINDINEGNGPEKVIFIIGYTGWGVGQLEFELENNLWIIDEPNNDIIFSENSNIKWELALATMGLNASEFIPTIGNA